MPGDCSRVADGSSRVTGVVGPRIILYMGKGGVGKTTVSAATASHVAHAGTRTLVVSTDRAHSLSDAFGSDIGDEPTQLDRGLYGMQVDGRLRLERNWGEIQSYVSDLLRWAGADELSAEEVAVVPGLDEVFGMAAIAEEVQTGRWGAIIVDCAPTADALRLLSLPDVLDVYMRKAFPAHRRAMRIARPLLSRTTTAPAPSDSVFDRFAGLLDELDFVRRVLTDHHRTTARIVMTPERMVLKESLRLHTYLELFGYALDGVVVNRVLPENSDDPWLQLTAKRQATVRSDAAASFAAVPVRELEWHAEEPIGDAALTATALALYGGTDPLERGASGPSIQIEAAHGGAVMSISLPDLSDQTLDLASVGDDLILTLGSHRRTISLPDHLSGHEAVDAEYADGWLHIRLVSERDSHVHSSR